MSVRRAVSAAVAGVAAGLVTRSLVRDRREADGDGRHPEGWKAVTILGDRAEFTTDLPQPLREISGALDMHVGPWSASSCTSSPGRRGS